MLILGVLIGIFATFFVTKLVMPAVNTSLRHHHDRVEADGPRINGIPVEPESDRIVDLFSRRRRNIPMDGATYHDDVPLVPEQLESH